MKTFTYRDKLLYILGQGNSMKSKNRTKVKIFEQEDGMFKAIVYFANMSYEELFVDRDSAEEWARRIQGK